MTIENIEQLFALRDLRRSKSRQKRGREMFRSAEGNSCL
jgi:hypothetical protein